MRCRLLYVIGELRSGGSERQLYLLLKSMDRARFRPHVVVWNFSDNQRYASPIRALDVPVHSFPAALSTIDKLRRLRRLVLDLKPEVLHSYSFYLNAVAYCATVRSNTNAIGSVRSDFVSDKKDSGLLIGSVSARWPRHQICNSVSALEFAQQSRSPFRPERLRVVRNGLDLKEAQWHPIPSSGHVCLLGVGSLIPLKRWDRLLIAASELKKRKFKFSVRIVGDGPLRSELEEQARSLGLDDCVEFTGPRDDVSALLADSILLLHTSNIEGCPNVVMEAMAAGRAVVALDAGDIPYLIEDGKTGFIVRRGDDEGLLGRVTALIADRNLCRRMGQAARDKAEREFSLERLVTDTLAAYGSAGWKDA